MTEVGYSILYLFNLILGVFSHLAPDLIYKNSETFKILSKIYCCTTIACIKACQLEALGAAGCGVVKNALYIADDKW